MILAAGRGMRMMPLTENTPKPLLKIGKHPLLEWHIINLKKAGFKNIVINISYLGEQIIKTIGDGEKYGVKIQYSDEKDNILETAGGIKKALPLLGDKAFIVVNSDIKTNFDFKKLSLKKNKNANLVLINNPDFNPNGDFYHHNSKQKYTFAGIAIYHPRFFENIPHKKAPLAPHLKQALENKDAYTTLYNGIWQDIGTPERFYKACGTTEKIKY
ncbi:MAG: hypothetical protein DRQ51_05535 [Gammaproteobacteria bacterium]|nr:MAG: hypothetical protein DRQ51_05535 [Gammaproteobacteria bacterium]